MTFPLISQKTQNEWSAVKIPDSSSLPAELCSAWTGEGARPYAGGGAFELGTVQGIDRLQAPISLRI